MALSDDAESLLSRLRLDARSPSQAGVEAIRLGTAHGVLEDIDSSSTNGSDIENWDPLTDLHAEDLPRMRRTSADTIKPAQQSIAASIPSELILEILKLLQNPKDLYAAMLTCQSWCVCSVELLWYKPILYTAPALIKLLPVLRRDGITFDYPSFIRRLNLSYL